MMKNLLKVSLVAVATIFASSAYAQSAAGDLKFGVNAGLNLSNFDVDGDGPDSKIGFQVGATVDYFLTDDIFLQSGLSFTTKGAKEGDVSANPMYLQLPVRAGYLFPVSDELSVNVNFGPYVAYGIGGKFDNGDVKVDYFDDNTKKFDMGLGAGVGAEYNSIVVNLGYEYGLVNIYDGEGDGKTKNLNAFLTVGYKF